MAELHEKYAPILRFARGERFFPMRVDNWLSYSSLYVKDQATPALRPGEVTPDRLAGDANSPHAFLRSVETGPLVGTDLVTTWGHNTVDLLYRWAQETAASWTEELARQAYSWFSPKTSPATALFWWNGLVTPLLKDIAASHAAGELPRLILPAETRNAAAERYEASCSRPPTYTYYYRQVYDGAYLCLQYWFFYAFNDWGRGFGGMNDHEGDWEGMLLFFRLNRLNQVQEPPAYITFVGHHSRLTKPWDHPEVERIGTHPVGYAAAGSHATYPQAMQYPLLSLYNLVDYASGGGPTIEPGDWVGRINLDSVPWLTNYQGSWGTRYWLLLERARSLLRLAATATPLSLAAAAVIQREIELPGVSAPHGPMLGDTGQTRPQWLGPVAWAGVPVPLESPI